MKTYLLNLEKKMLDEGLDTVDGIDLNEVYERLDEIYQMTPRREPEEFSAGWVLMPPNNKRQRRNFPAVGG